jgi:hypothetical protein
MPNPVVKYAVYGALPNGSANNAKAFDVTKSLQNSINNNNGIVSIENSSFAGDPAPNNTKHFGAIVARGNQNFYFACQEGQQIDFIHDGGVALSTPLQVVFAVYGALPGGNQDDARASDVTAVLQSLLAQNNGTVAINNVSFGGDPSPSNTKHFAAVVKRGGSDYYFACQEGQTIDFNVGGTAGH